ncbi:hypothetical protein BDV27DRAFT_125841 [Aspergillus caelatus]|uniref:Uncharacterized protein n=1 Tax=Aspergillus caelatus TaxID=61420 RepID=A0A5N7AA92_9EURO|nr:uncharacterized protein BDV27DRAFT_125841 [Aspergillus caelatus]KAE8366086.1 hypothetical protein BDV27DRAFT_125841 [Aspergillus caelatus]
MVSCDDACGILFLFVSTSYGTIQVWCFEFRQPTQYLSFFNCGFCDLSICGS